jgi:hypothetical protein
VRGVQYGWSVSIRSRARRTTAAFAAWLLVASIVLIGWHRATVLHGKCLEHGEEVHLEKLADRAPAASDSVAPSNWLQVEGDSHCEILATAHTPLAAAHAPVAHHVVVVTIADAPPIAIATPIAAALYRLAPKTSPPRA